MKGKITLAEEMEIGYMFSESIKGTILNGTKYLASSNLTDLKEALDNFSEVIELKCVMIENCEKVDYEKIANGLVYNDTIRNILSDNSVMSQEALGNTDFIITVFDIYAKEKMEEYGYLEDDTPLDISTILDIE